MANAIYPLYKQDLIAGTTSYDLDNDTVTDGPYTALIHVATHGYVSSDRFYSVFAGANVGTDQRITVPTIAQGVFDGGDLLYTAVSGATIEAILVYRHNSGASSTWPLVMWYDTAGGGLPATPNGGNISVTWNIGGIFVL